MKRFRALRTGFIKRPLFWTGGPRVGLRFARSNGGAARTRLRRRESVYLKPFKGTQLSVMPSMMLPQEGAEPSSSEDSG